MTNGLMIAYIAISVLIIILVLSQKSKDNGFSTMTGAKANDGREVGKTFDKKLQSWTAWLVVLYIILSVVFTFYQQKSSVEEKSEFLDDDIYQEELDEVENDTEDTADENAEGLVSEEETESTENTEVAE